MKRKLYTTGHNIDLLKQVDNEGGKFTAEEHAYILEKEFGGRYSSKETLLRHWLPLGANKLSALGYLIQFMSANNYKNVLSLGAGSCVLEYFLQMALPEDSNVVATDFNGFFIERAKALFPEIKAVKFDFFKDDARSLLETYPAGFDVAVFFGSSYVMEDEEFIALFGSLRANGVKCIVDFCAGFMDFRSFLNNLYWDIKMPLTKLKFARKLLGKKPLIDDYKGKFHGYSRNKGELRRLYRLAGFSNIEELSVDLSYKYAAILRV